jgi:putative hydrolase of the HAD superfamily
VPLLMLDLDNTLVDRDAAFRQAGKALLTEHGVPDAEVDWPREVDWLMEIDRSGYAPRRDVATALLQRHPGLDPAAVRHLVDMGAAEGVRLTDPVRASLRRAAALGWTLVVVTNGAVRQQETKLRVSGLDAEVAGWVVSEAAGVRKPHREIFAAAAATVGADLSEGGWHVGDAPLADVGGATEAGLSSVWLRLGRRWPTELAFRPTYVADDLPGALDHVLEAG